MNWLNTFSNVGIATPLFNEGVTWNGSEFEGSYAFQIPANSSSEPLLFDVSNSNSYDFNFQVGVQNQGNAGAAMGPGVILSWYDDQTSGIPVFEEDWWPWGNGLLGTSGLVPNAISGTGPMHGQYMTIVMKNTGNTLMQLNWSNLYGTNRPTPYSDWRQNLTGYSIAINGLTNLTNSFVGLPSSGFENVLAAALESATVPNGDVFVPLGLYAGPVQYDIQAGVSAFQGTTTINTISYALSGGLTHARQGAGVVWDDSAALSSAANAGVRGQTMFPRAACALIMQGNAAGTSTVTYEFTAQQAA